MDKEKLKQQLLKETDCNEETINMLLNIVLKPSPIYGEDGKLLFNDPEFEKKFRENREKLR